MRGLWLCTLLVVLANPLARASASSRPGGFWVRVRSAASRLAGRGLVSPSTPTVASSNNLPRDDVKRALYQMRRELRDLPPVHGSSRRIDDAAKTVVLPTGERMRIERRPRAGAFDLRAPKEWLVWGIEIDRTSGLRDLIVANARQRAAARQLVAPYLNGEPLIFNRADRKHAQQVWESLVRDHRSRGLSPNEVTLREMTAR